MKLLSIFSSFYKRRLSEEIWMAGFTSGFNKAWDMMQPLMMKGVQESKKMIEEIAIMETIKRNSNGNHKKIN